MAKVRVVNYQFLEPNPGELGDELIGGHVLGGGPFSCEIVDPDLPYRLTLRARVQHGRLVCDQLLAERKRGRQPITTEGLRVPLDGFLQLAMRDHPLLLSRVARGTHTFASQDQRKEIAGRDRQARASTRAEVVRAYRRALRDKLRRDRATQEVADELVFSRGYVSLLLSEARRLGELPPTARGRGGRPHGDADRENR